MISHRQDERRENAVDGGGGKKIALREAVFNGLKMNIDQTKVKSVDTIWMMLMMSGAV